MKISKMHRQADTLVMNYECLPCLVNQAVRVADITNADNRDALFKKIFAYLSKIDFSKSNPEIIGSTFRLIKEHIDDEDPYQATRTYYNQLFLDMLGIFETKITESCTPFETALKYTIIGNMINFNPIHNSNVEDMKWFDNIENLSLTINHTEQMMNDLITARSILYLGDNCGEICLDKLLIKQIRKINSSTHIYFCVRGAAVVNDSIEADAYFVGMDEYADIISNGDDSLGTVLDRTSAEFNQIYTDADGNNFDQSTNTYCR